MSTLPNHDADRNVHAPILEGGFSYPPRGRGQECPRSQISKGGFGAALRLSILVCLTGYFRRFFGVGLAFRGLAIAALAAASRAMGTRKGEQLT